MNWDLAIERHQGRLLGLVLALFAEIGLAGDDAVKKLSRPVYRYALRQLRKAEAAARRLIFIAARNIVLEPEDLRAARPRRKPPAKTKAEGSSRGETKIRRKRRPVFKLFDPPRRLKALFGRLAKRKQVLPPLRVVDVGADPLVPLFLVFRPQEPPPAPPPEKKASDGMVDATKLIRRVLALTEALADIPGQAMRLARWQAKPIEERRPARWSPLRSGRPPGYRERPRHEIDEILKDCDWLARNVMPALDDTS
ncbi:MAG: hypothetical protein JNM20_03760 [Rhizobiales bacterium]|nr:hypothetical protein [Hyphomicrobiales bacterium]